MAFDDAKKNFLSSARYGLEAQLTWLGGKTHTASSLIRRQLLPIARAGLATSGVDSSDIERYLDVIEARVRKGRTGAQWALDSLEGLEGESTKDARHRALVASMCRQEQAGAPIHEWELADSSELSDWRESCRTVGQIMVTDVFTVHPEDLVDLAASVMEWEHVRHVPVEDQEGRLVGLISHRQLMRMIGRGVSRGEAAEAPQVAVRDIMQTDVHTVTPETPTHEAMQRMAELGVGCLPVVRKGMLVGILTEHDFMIIARGLLQRELAESSPAARGA